MNPTKQKYLTTTASDGEHVGNFVHWFIKQTGHKKKDVSNYLQVAPTTLASYFKQPSLQFGILWRISQAIQYNLVMDLGQRLQIPFETKTEKELRAQLAEKEERIKELEIQLGVLREVKG